MRTGLLRGSEHTQLGAISTLAEGRAAIALSRGGAPKTYRYTDPNEDACAFAYSGESSLVAVADGHWGAGGAAAALERILSHHAPRWLESTGLGATSLASRWCDEAPDVLADLNHALLSQAGESLIGRTTLSLCLQPAGGKLLVLAAGDSHVFAYGGKQVREVCPMPAGARPCYLGDPSLDRGHLQAGARADVISGYVGAVLLSTDGLSEPGIGVDNPVASAAHAMRVGRSADGDLKPLSAARSLAAEALNAQRRNRAGDNVGVACLWQE